MMPRRILYTVLGSVTLLLSFFCTQVQAHSAKVNYILNCQGCHLPDGAATPGKVPALKNEVGRFLQVKGGREFLIRVPGTSQSALSDAEVAEVLNWILKNFSQQQLPDNFQPYTSNEITAYRRPPLANVGEVRKNLVTEIAKLDKGELIR